MGRLTADPEVRQTPNGVSVCSFTIANDKDFKRDGDAPNWIDCVAWRNNAEFIGKYFKKGSLIVVTGSLQTRQYQDKNGNNRKATEIVVNQQYFAESKKDNADVQTHETPAPQQSGEIDISADEVRFTADSQDDLPF